MIPFSPPRIDQAIIDEVVDTLKSGWITTGPKTRLFEKNLSEYCDSQAVICLSSATAGLELMLRWYGVKAGDEVIVPAYTYAATANVVIHCGAKPVFADVGADFNIDIDAVKKLINTRTKAVMPVDFGGWPCDYDALNQLLNSKDIKQKFNAETKEQKTLGRVLLISDAAHSLGARYKGRKTGSLADVSIFSFHAVKNLTTAEGGAVALNLPGSFDNLSIYNELSIKTLHGQNKDAFTKMQKGNWRYDILEPGYKMNMTDLLASMGIVELKRYESDTLIKRKKICMIYRDALKSSPWAVLPLQEKMDDGLQSESSYHLFPLRIKGINEKKRDLIIHDIFEQDVSVNVHFIPLPMMSYYKSAGYDISNYPVAYSQYENEISLPVFYDLTADQQEKVIRSLKIAVEKINKLTI